MRIPRIDQLLDDCENHLSSTGSTGTEIEYLLTRSVLVLICAQFEEKIRATIREKCDTVDDESLRTFLDSCVRAVFRSLKVDEMGSLLNRFGSNHKENFKERISVNPQAVTLYNNLVTNRHQVAHADRLHMSLHEVKGFYEQGHIILDFFREALLGGNA
ncbi:MAG: HEPN domain-containing protein [Thermodesulfobacteriota bacterium]